MTEQPRAEARVDLGAIRRNVEALTDHARTAAVMAVVKADGYGHGMVPSARAALAGGATWLGTAYPSEAAELRAAGIDAPMLAWLVSPGEDVTGVLRAGVDLSASSVRMVEHVAAQARSAGVTARLHLEIDTGLSRAGATAADWPDLVDAARKAEADGTVRAVGVWSHFVHADRPDHPTTDRQVAAYRDALALAEARGLRPEVRHLANSAATLTRPDTHFDVVRPGIAVYGLSPVPDLGGPAAYGLTPAMTLAARVAVVKRVPAGSGVSYGHAYTTSRETTLVLVPLGYADGVPRSATNTAEVWLAGGRRRVAGRVCMDQFVVDVGDHEVAEGDEIVLFGPGDAGEPTAEDWAQALGTICYEIVTRIGPRTPRTYVGGRP